GARLTRVAGPEGPGTAGEARRHALEKSFKRPQISLQIQLLHKVRVHSSRKWGKTPANRLGRTEPVSETFPDAYWHTAQASGRARARSLGPRGGRAFGAGQERGPDAPWAESFPWRPERGPNAGAPRRRPR